MKSLNTNVKQLFWVCIIVSLLCIFSQLVLIIGQNTTNRFTHLIDEYYKQQLSGVNEFPNWISDSCKSDLNDIESRYGKVTSYQKSSGGTQFGNIHTSISLEIFYEDEKKHITGWFIDNGECVAINTVPDRNGY